MPDTTTDQLPNKEACKTHSSGCGGSQASLVISLLALLLASYAVFNVTSTPADATRAVEAKVNAMENSIIMINSEISRLGEEVESNRENLVQTKLKKALQNIQEISNLAEENTKSAISEIEAMLQILTGDKLDKVMQDHIEEPKLSEKTDTEEKSQSDATERDDAKATDPDIEANPSQGSSTITDDTHAPAVEPTSEPQESTLPTL